MYWGVLLFKSWLHKYGHLTNVWVVCGSPGQLVQNVSKRWICSLFIFQSWCNAVTEWGCSWYHMVVHSTLYWEGVGGCWFGVQSVPIDPNTPLFSLGYTDLTWVGLWWCRRHVLVWFNWWFRCESIKMLFADDFQLLKVLNFLLYSI